MPRGSTVAGVRSLLMRSPWMRSPINSSTMGEIWHSSRSNPSIEGDLRRPPGAYGAPIGPSHVLRDHTLGGKEGPVQGNGRATHGEKQIGILVIERYRLFFEDPVEPIGV